MKFIQYFSLRNGIDTDPIKYHNHPQSNGKIKRAVMTWNKEEKRNNFLRAIDILSIYEKAAKFDKLQLDIVKISEEYRELAAEHARLLIAVNAQKVSIWSKIKNALFKTIIS